MGPRGPPAVTAGPGACVGYAPQAAWVLHGSVRDNILLQDAGQQVDEERYQQVSQYS